MDEAATVCWRSVFDLAYQSTITAHQFEISEPRLMQYIVQDWLIAENPETFRCLPTRNRLDEFIYGANTGGTIESHHAGVGERNAFLWKLRLGRVEESTEIVTGVVVPQAR